MFTKSYTASKRLPAYEQAWAQFAAQQSPEAFCSSWLVIQCHAIGAVSSGLVVLQRSGSAAFAPVAFYPEKQRDPSGLARISEAALKAGKGIVEPTVATNMAGRGTDIKLAPGVAERGGLHVIATELNDSARIDRQLFGRCARQGDLGSCQAILAIEEDLLVSFLPVAVALLRGLGGIPRWPGRLVFAAAQWRAERTHSRARRDLLDLDDYLGDILAFSGRGE